MRASVVVTVLAGCGRFGFDARNDAAGPGDTPGMNGRCLVTSVAVGRSHTCMVERGTVWCWGAASGGQVVPGLEPPSYQLMPARVTLPAPAVQVAAGRTFSCARLDTGDVYCWGQNFEGELGDGTMLPRTEPVKVALGSEHAIDLASGAYHACIRRESDQGVMCWGANDHRQAGAASGLRVLTPTLVANTAGSHELGVGHKHNCIVDVTGQARCWGRGEFGQLADVNVTNDRAAALPGMNLTGSLVAVAAGGRHTCSLDAAGNVRCWGKNQESQLGSAPVESGTASESAIIATDIRDIQASTAGACGLRNDGKLVCWGGAVLHQYGYSPVPRERDVSNVESFVQGYYHACAIEAGGQLKCWGANSEGELGRGFRAITPTPQPVAITATALSLRRRTVCARVSGDDIRCWGANDTGTLPIGGDRLEATTPISIPHGLTNVLGFDIGAWHGCAWNATTVRCWGLNTYGQTTASAPTLYQLTAQTVAGIANPTQVAVGDMFTCVLSGTTVQCWGANNVGQLGNGVPGDSTTPVTVAGLTNPTVIAAANVHACAIDGGALRCWGEGTDGELGDGAGVMRRSSVATGLTNVTDVALGDRHTCAIANNLVYCFGLNDVGQLGTGDLNNQLSPAQVTFIDPSPPIDVVATIGGTCARLMNGKTFCWGGNGGGQLGDGTFTGRETPWEIPTLAGADEIVRALDGGCMRKGASVSCWGVPTLLGNGDTSSDTAMPPSGCE